MQKPMTADGGELACMRWPRLYGIFQCKSWPVAYHMDHRWPVARPPYHIGCRDSGHRRGHMAAHHGNSNMTTGSGSSRSAAPPFRLEEEAAAAGRKGPWSPAAARTPCRWVIRIPCHRTVTRQDCMD
jgi:hypothetical protein